MKHLTRINRSIGTGIDTDTDTDLRNATIALGLMALLGVALIFLFPGCPEQDTDYHFLEARTAWSNPWLFVDVWGRPLYTSFYALPALLGFTATRFFAVGIGVVTAWQTWRLARDLCLERAWLVVPLLLGQPVFFELFPDLLTEPLFAFVFVVALRWHLGGPDQARNAGGLSSAARKARRGLSLSHLGCLGGGQKHQFTDLPANVDLSEPHSHHSFDADTCHRCFLLVDCSDLHHARSSLHSPQLASDLASRRLWSRHTFQLWPARAGIHRRAAGRAVCHRPLVQNARADLGPIDLLVSPFLSFAHFFPCLWTFRRGGLPALHGIGCAGHCRALIGRMECYRISDHAMAALSRVVGWTVLGFSLVQSFLYLDSFSAARDTIAVREMFEWLQKHPKAYQRLVWSNARMCIVSGLTLVQSPSLGSSSREATLALLRNAPSGTLVFWDNHFGPNWFGLTAGEIEENGYQRLRTRDYSLPGVVIGDAGGRRDVELSLLFKP